MGFSVEYSGLVITHLLYKAAVVLAAVRWILSWAFGYMGLGLGLSETNDGEIHRPATVVPSSVSAQTIRNSLHVSTYSEIGWRLPEGCGGGTCAVCLNQLKGRDKVWELRNCCHVFHKRCLDRWLDHDEHKTCPLCRSPLLGRESSSELDRSEPSWEVERLLYLFGDDLLFSS